MAKLWRPTLNEQDMQVLSAALDTLVRSQGLSIAAAVTVLTTKIDASVADAAPPTETPEPPPV